MTVVLVANEKEVLPNGRLREGLRSRAKEREAMLAEIEALKVVRWCRIRFVQPAVWKLGNSC